MTKPTRPPAPPRSEKPVSLKMLAERLGLSPSTISFVLNNAPGRSIPDHTRERIRQAAAAMNYRPSIIAQTLRGQPMRTIGVILPELGEGYHTRVVSGIGDLLMERGYFYFTATHRHNKKLVETYPALLQARGVDGLLAVDTHLEHALPLPTVLIAGHSDLKDVINVTLDHEKAARLALEHLYTLGHRDIVYIKGQAVSTDTELRWQATVREAKRLKLTMRPEHVLQLTEDSTSPHVSYPLMRALLKHDRHFTAVLCFNDISAIGCIRALYERGLRVPDDVSVLGFDDIQSASFHTPSLTTIRQPLQDMGWQGATALLSLLAGEEVPPSICVEPSLVKRESTAALPTKPATRTRRKSGQDLLQTGMRSA